MPDSGLESKMEKYSERDYKFLLSKIIPLEALSQARRFAIEKALSGGERMNCLREALKAMEELCEAGIYRRDGIVRSDRCVSIGYRSSKNPVSITLAMSNEEWRIASGREGQGDSMVPSVLAGIISSLSLDDSPKTIVTRIEEMLSLAGHVFPGSSAHLLFVNAISSIGEWGDGKIAYLPMGEALKKRFYHACLTGGNRYTVISLEKARGDRGAFPVEPGTGCILLIPLLARDIKWAVLEVHIPSGTVGKSEISNFSIIGQGIIRLLENNQHFEKMVAIDRLTQVPNRNSYELQLPLEIERSNRLRSPFAFLLIDIDDFKLINDKYGHAAGDRVLRLAAQMIRRSLRKIDFLFRYGGEEFVVLLPGADPDSAKRTAERIRAVAAKTDYILEDGRRVRVTLSIGGCIYPVHAQNEAQLFRKADKALYQAKEEGKNRVVMSDE